MGLLWERPSGETSRIALWQIDETEDELTAMVSGRVQAGDLEAALSARSPGRRMERLAVLAMTDILFGGRCRLMHREDGAPYLIYKDTAVGAPPRISITHTDGHAALMADTLHDGGIDMEPAARDFSAAVRALSPAEAAALPEDPADRNLRLGTVWCAKEAVYKRAGVSGLDFGSQIEVGGLESPAFTADGEGTLTAAVRYPDGGVGTFRLRSRVAGGLIMVWTLD